MLIQSLLKRVVAILVTAVVTVPAIAASNNEAAEIKTVKQVFKTMVGGEEPEIVSPSPIAGMYEVVSGAQVVYISGDGRYILQGDLFDISQKQNVTENARSQARKKLIDSADESTMIVFKPKGVETKYTITVFTDIDCGYCRKLHKEIDTYLKEGIKVRYMSFPRAGLNSESYYKAVTVWCSKDQQAAITEAKSGKPMKQLDCKNPVADHMKLADAFGVTGTPTIVMSTGAVIPGYVPAKTLLQYLKKGSI